MYSYKKNGYIWFNAVILSENFERQNRFSVSKQTEQKYKEVDMKKIIACISLVFAMSAGATALAATTAEPGSNNSVDVTNDAVYNTVLIEHSTTKDIVYVNQNDEGYTTAAVNFLLKANPEYGTYNVTLGKTDGSAPVATTFEINDPNPDIVIPPAFDGVNASGERVVGFSLKTDRSLSAYTKLHFTATKAGETPGSVTIDPNFTTLSGESEVDVSVEVTGVPEGATLTVSLTK